MPVYAKTEIHAWDVYRMSVQSLDSASAGNAAGALVDAEPPAERDPYNYFNRQLDYAASPPTAPDGTGLWSDTKYFFGYQVFFIGLLYILPESVTSWSDEQKEKDHLSAWSDNVESIQWDGDRDAVNYIGHPYFGSIYYARARERGYGPQGAFWYTAGLSAAFEFGAEAFFESPSIQDLVSTPIFGGMLGYWFEGVRNKIRQEALVTGEFSGTDKFILAATDLLGYLNAYTDRLLGKSVASASAQFSLTPPLAGEGSLAHLSARDMPLRLWLNVHF